VRVVYVSYDGALDPLGGSQVVPYIVGLSQRGVRYSLVSFEKAERWSDTDARDALQRRLVEAGVRWIALPYHRRPRLLAKALDLSAGARAIRREVGEGGPAIVHCRGDMAMAMARWTRGPSLRLLYDIRGFFADERVEGGSWARGGIVDRAVRRLEAGNWSRADGFVVLTEAARRRLGQRHSSFTPHRVIPTCVDLARFRPDGDPTRKFSVVYGGSMGSAYPSDAIVAFARREGILLDPVYTGKAAAGMIDHIRKGIVPQGSTVVFIHTGGQPALFAQSRALMNHINQGSRARRQSEAKGERR